MKNEIVVFDTETSGMPDWKMPSEADNQPHIVQLAAVVVDTQKRNIKQSINVIVKPSGWLIDPETTKIHGITTEYAMDVGISEGLAIEMFIELVKGKTRVAHNTTFDNRIIRIGLKRYFPDKADAFKELPYYCTLQNSRKIMGGKSGHTLAEALKHFTGKDLVNAHNAMADTLGCMDLYFGIQDNLSQEN